MDFDLLRRNLNSFFALCGLVAIFLDTKAHKEFFNLTASVPLKRQLIFKY